MAVPSTSTATTLAAASWRRRWRLGAMAASAARALGTRFTVRRDGASTLLSMLESTVSAQVPQHPASIVQAGQRTRITRDGVGPLTAIDAASVQEAWRAHRLVVDDQPLAEVLDELTRHRPGQLHYDRAQIAGIRVAAVLPLDDTDKALQLLIDNFPQLRIRKAWLTW